jgi:hypothetical protein
VGTVNRGPSHGTLRRSMLEPDSLKIFERFTSNKHLAMILAWFFLGAILSYLLGVLVLPFSISPYMRSA